MKLPGCWQSTVLWDFLASFSFTLVLYLENSFNMFFLCFVALVLTINHAAMRTAVPAFVYSLSLLNVQLGLNRKKGIRIV
jgi:hypothetical protein